MGSRVGMKEGGCLCMARAWDMVHSSCVLETTDEDRACALV